ncbi:Protein SUPPRESSOR OF npr1-1, CONSTITUTIVE 1, partial [Linum perenne]
MNTLQNIFHRTFIPNTSSISLYVVAQFENVGKAKIRNLIVIPDLSKSLKLEELVLMNCISLVELPSHVQYLTKLITLDLRDCKSLKHIP